MGRPSTPPSWAATRTGSPWPATRRAATSPRSWRNWPATTAGPTLAFQLLWYPTVTADLSLPSYTENASAAILDRDVIEAFLSWYLPGLDISDSKALPTTLAPANAADLSGLPPAFIGTAEHDPLRDDGARYAELLSAAGCRSS